jgi:hypothetical protein
VILFLSITIFCCPSHSVPLLGAYSGNILIRGSKQNAANESVPFELTRPSAPRAIVFHGTSCFYRNESITFYKRDVNTIFIGRYMLERTDFTGGFTNDEFYVAHCSGLVRNTNVRILMHISVIFLYGVTNIIELLKYSLRFRWMKFGYQLSGTEKYSQRSCSRWV